MPELILKLGDEVLDKLLFDKDIVSIGRARDNDVVVENLSVSRNHARIRRQSGKYVLTDLNSANGTFVNGVKITKTEIVDNDIIAIGKHKIHFVNKPVSDEALITEALAADRTMVVDRAPLGMLCVTEGKLKGKEFPLTKFETSVGKASTNDVVLSDDWFLSKKQAVIVRRDQRFEIQDLGGFRKTRLNSQPLAETAELRPGDVLEFGNTRCVFQLTSEAELAGPGARVPHEMGLDDSVYSSVSDFRANMDSIAKQAEESRSPTREATPQPVAEPAPPKPAEEEQPIPAAVEQRGGKRRKRDRDRERERERTDFVTESFTADDALKQAMAGIAAEAEALPAEEPEPPLAPEPFELAPEPEAPVAAAEPDLPQPEPAIPPPTPSVGVAAAGAPDDIQLWEAALKNRSPVIRHMAVKMLKKLTGRDYEA
jgi:pSer/pThr/pTyr-binding forkhead associated (FHA) protein